MGREASVRSAPATMEQQNLKTIFALILMFGGPQQLTLGRSFLVETENKPAADYSLATTKAYSLQQVQDGIDALKAEMAQLETTCYININKTLTTDLCHDFNIAGFCTHDDCLKKLGDPKDEICFKNCLNVIGNISKEEQIVAK